LVQPLVDVDLESMRYYKGAQVRILHPAARRQGGIISRTGYTGEDGFEFSIGAGIAQDVWEALLEIGKPLGVVPTGIAARDTLRLEAGMPLYGHELSEEIDPFQAGLGFACYLEGVEFPGRDALLRIREQPPRAVRVGLKLASRRVARQGCAVLGAGESAGWVTSGTFSPTLQESIAMAYVRPEWASPGTEMSVDVRGRQEPARVTTLPFYRRSVKGTRP
jgi:aminomethyltransferase